MGKLGLFMSDINHNIPIYVRVSPPGQTEKKRGGGKKKKKRFKPKTFTWIRLQQLQEQQNPDLPVSVASGCVPTGMQWK